MTMFRLFTAFLSATVPAAPPTTDCGDYRLGAGDVVKITVRGEEDLPGTYKIAVTCTIDMLLIGGVEFCRMITAEPAEHLRARLSPDYLLDPNVIVQIEECGSQLIEVKEEVKRPGLQPLRGPTTLWQTITNVGCPTGVNIRRVNRRIAHDLVLGPEGKHIMRKSLFQSDHAMKVAGIPARSRQILYAVGDVVLAVVVLYIGHWLRMGWDGRDIDLFDILDVSTGASYFFVATHIGVLNLADGYNHALDYRRPKEIFRLWLAVVAALLLQMTILYSLPHWRRWGRGITAVGTLSFGTMLVASRWLICRLRPRRSLIQGAERAGTALAAVFQGRNDYGVAYQPVGFLHHAAEEAGELPVFSGTSDLDDLIGEYGIQTLIVAIRSGMRPELLKGLLRAKAAGMQIVDMPSVYKNLTGKVPILHIAETWLIFGPNLTGYGSLASLATRAMDVAAGIVWLGLFGPIVVLAGLAVKLDSKEPKFYMQERVGLNEQNSTIWKLRTMRSEAEKGAGAVWS